MGNTTYTETSPWETYDIQVCSDCLMMIANGTTGDYDGAPDDAEHDAAMDALWPDADGWDITPNCSEDCEGGFSWSPCEGCGSPLGGDRHPAVAMRWVGP